MHDPTFWQPLALSQKAAQGGGSVPADIQTFENSQWGHVRTFAARVDAGPPRLGDPSSAAYKQAAVAAIRATSRAGAPPVVDASPLGWNRVAASLPAGTGAAARLAHDVRLDLALNGALNDAAVSAWGAKRAYQSPRPISMIRYLAFNDQLPLVPGLIKRVGGQQLVLRAGRWVPGARWSPLAPTPPSPGWASGDSAFAYAAGRGAHGVHRPLVRRTGRPGRDAGRRPRHRAAGRRHGGPRPRHEGRQARVAQARRLTRTANTSTVAVALLQRLQTPTAGTVIGALLIILGGIIYVSGAVTAGTVVAIAGFGLILKYRVLPARRERNKQRKRRQRRQPARARRSRSSSSAASTPSPAGPCRGPGRSGAHAAASG